VVVLHQLNTGCRDFSRLAKAEHVDPRAGSQGGQKQLEWLRGGAAATVRYRLIGFDHVRSEACFDLFPAGEGDFDVHGRESQGRAERFG